MLITIHSPSLRTKLEMEFGLNDDQWQLDDIDYLSNDFKHKTLPILIELTFKDSVKSAEISDWSVYANDLCIHIGYEKELDHKLIEFICERYEWMIDNLNFDDDVREYPECLLCGNNPITRIYQSASHFYECHNTVTKSASKQ